MSMTAYCPQTDPGVTEPMMTKEKRQNWKQVELRSMMQRIRRSISKKVEESDQDQMRLLDHFLPLQLLSEKQHLVETEADTQMLCKTRKTQYQ